jgi:hypothetical protein
MMGSQEHFCLHTCARSRDIGTANLLNCLAAFIPSESLVVNTSAFD